MRNVNLSTEGAYYSLAGTAAFCLWLWGNEKCYTDAQETQPNVPVMVCKKIVLELCAIVLLGVALVEGVVRGIFAVLFIGGLLLPEGKAREAYNKYFFQPFAIGSAFTFINVACIAQSLYYNLTNESIRDSKETAEKMLDPFQSCIDEMDLPGRPVPYPFAHLGGDKDKWEYESRNKVWVYTGDEKDLDVQLELNSEPLAPSPSAQVASTKNIFWFNHHTAKWRFGREHRYEGYQDYSFTISGQLTFKPST